MASAARFAVVLARFEDVVVRALCAEGCDVVVCGAEIWVGG